MENGIFQQTFNCGSSGTACPALAFPNVLFTASGTRALGAAFPGALTPVRDYTGISLPLTTQLVRGMIQDFVNPLVLRRRLLTIEHQLPGGNMSLSPLRGLYLFSRGQHLPVFVDTNLGPTTGTQSYAVLNAPPVTRWQAPSTTVPWYPGGAVALTASSPHQRAISSPAIAS